MNARSTVKWITLVPVALFSCSAPLRQANQPPPANALPTLPVPTFGHAEAPQVRATAGEQSGVLSWHQAHAAIAKRLVGSYRGDRKKPMRIAVVDFTTPAGGVCELGSPLAEAIGNDLFEAQEFAIIERRLLDKVLKEQGINRSQLSDPDTAARMGKLVGVGGLVTGTVTRADGELMVNARLVHVETGTMMATAAVSLDRIEGDRIGRCDGVAPRTEDTVAPPAPTRNPATGTGQERRGTAEYVQGLTHEYFNMPPWSGSPPSLTGMAPVLVVVHPGLVRFVGRTTGSPAKDVSAEYFAVRVTGELLIETAGTYAFENSSSAMSPMIVVGTSVYSPTGSNEPKSFYFKPGWYKFGVTLLHPSNSYYFWLNWRRPGDNDFGPIAPPLLRTVRR